jgi:hypothetical protein
MKEKVAGVNRKGSAVESQGSDLIHQGSVHTCPKP